MQRIKPFNDREQIVLSAQLQNAAKSKRITEFQKANRTAKKDRNRKKRQVDRAAETALKNMYSEEHTLDPYMIFDSLGNVTMAGLVSSNTDDTFSRPRGMQNSWPTASTSRPSFEETTTVNADSKHNSNIEMTPIVENEFLSSDKQSSDISMDTSCTFSNTKEPANDIGSFEIKNIFSEALVKESQGLKVEKSNVIAERIKINSFVEKFTVAKSYLEEEKPVNTKKSRKAPSTPTVTRSGRIVKPKVM